MTKEPETHNLANCMTVWGDLSSTVANLGDVFLHFYQSTTPRTLFHRSLYHYLPTSHFKLSLTLLIVQFKPLLTADTLCHSI